MLKKVISGGQTGADFAGLCAARDFGIATGGTAPNGWRICDFSGRDSKNPNLELFGLVQHQSSQYPPRTKQNVADADGTVWFGYDRSPGGRLTINTAIALNKHRIINPSVEEFTAWVESNNIEVLNVAGNRLSADNPSIHQDVYRFLVEAFTLLGFVNQDRQHSIEIPAQKAVP